ECPICSTRVRSAARIVGESSTIKTFMLLGSPCAPASSQAQEYNGSTPAPYRDARVGGSPRPRPKRRGRSAAGAQQGLEIGDEVRDAALAHQQTQASLSVEHVAAGAVIHGVAVGRLSGRLLVENLEFLRHLGGRGRIAVEPQEAGVERGH